MNKLSTASYKGVRDYFPEDFRLRQYIFDSWMRIGNAWGYEGYDASVIEPLDIYVAKTSEEIVKDQTFNFTDRGGRQLTLRPEMTPSVSRMVAAKRQEFGYPLRLISIPNCFRYERMQRGRNREFYQLNMDLFGIAGVEAEIEQIAIADQIMRAFGAPEGSYTIKVNSRQLINVALEQAGASDSANLLRLIDRKDKIEPDKFQTELADLCRDPALINEFLEKGLDQLPESLQQTQAWMDLDTVMSQLSSSGVTAAVYSPDIARGFDYYTGIVFEVFDNNPENNRSMYGGGRYDGLVGVFGAEPVPTMGFAMGDAPLENFLESWNLVPQLSAATDAMVIAVGVDLGSIMPLASQLRAAGLNVATGDTRKPDKQIKSAQKLAINQVIFVGEQELESQTYQLKDLTTGEQAQLSVAEIADRLSKA